MTDLYQFIFFNWLLILIVWIVWFCLGLVVAFHFGGAVRYGDEDAAEE